MNKIFRFLPAATCIAGLLSPLAAPAQDTAASNFEAVAKHLETGGVFYGLVDVEGDSAKFAGLGDGLLELAKQEAGGALPAGLTASGVLKSLGLERLKAFGMSSKPTRGNLFHNRAIAYLPEGRSGLFKLFGGPAAPLQSPRVAPADSDLVMESEVTLGALLEISEALLRSTGDDLLLQQYRGLLGFPVPGLEMTAGDFINRLNTRIIVAGRLEKGKTFTLPGSDLPLPCFRLVVSFDQLDFLAAPIMEYATQTGGMIVENGDGFQLIKPKTAAPDQPDFLQPLFYHDLKSKRLLLATHPDAVAEFLSGKSILSEDPAFKEAFAGFPGEANELSYLTPAVYGALRQFMETAMKSVPSFPGGPDAAGLKLMVRFLDEMSPLPTHPTVSLRANLPEGMLFLSNSTSSFKSILTLPAGLATGMLAAGSSGAFETYRRMRNLPTESKNETSNDAEDNESGPQDIRSNLQQIAFAAQSYFVEKADATEVTYEQLIEAELLFKMEPVNGESYQGLKLKKTGGTLTVKLQRGSTVSQTYGPVTD